MKSILHLIETGGPGGAESVFLELAVGLRLGSAEAIAAVGREGWLAAQVRARGLTPVILPAQGSLNFGYLKQLAGLIRHHDVGLVVAHLFGAAVYASLAGLLTRVPVVSVLHGQSDVADKERFAALKRWVVARGSARVVFVSSALRAALQRRLKLPERKVLVIENGIAMDRLLQPDGGALKASLGLPSSAFLIGAVGNVRPAKGYETLLHAAREVCARDANVHFVIAGDTCGELFGRLDQLRRSLGLTERVRFLGLRSDVPQILAGLDLYVLSSDTEGFSLALVEAMASGLPVIATRSGGPETLVEAEATGLLVAPRDPQALATAMHTLLENAPWRARLAAAARAAITARFDSGRMIAEYTRLAESLGEVYR